MKTHLVPAMCVVLAVVLWQPAARAQVAAVTVSYPAGWNLAGGPPGTDLSAASILDGYATGSYFTPSLAATALCQGYWAYFPMATTVALPINATGPTQDCRLQSGWNLVGNPFAGAAALPGGVTGYYWDTKANAYQVVNVIPLGGAAWIEVGGPTTLTLRYQAAINSYGKIRRSTSGRPR